MKAGLLSFSLIWLIVVVLSYALSRTLALRWKPHNKPHWDSGPIKARVFTFLGIAVFINMAWLIFVPIIFSLWVWILSSLLVMTAATQLTVWFVVRIPFHRLAGVEQAYADLVARFLGQETEFVLTDLRRDWKEIHHAGLPLVTRLRRLLWQVGCSLGPLAWDAMRRGLHCIFPVTEVIRWIRMKF